MLGVKCFELGRAYFQHLDVRALARPILRDMVDKLKENAYLTTRIGYEVLYIEKHEVEKEVGILSRFGRVLPMYASASGKIFLAHFDERELKAYREDQETRGGSRGTHSYKGGGFLCKSGRV